MRPSATDVLPTPLLVPAITTTFIPPPASSARGACVSGDISAGDPSQQAWGGPSRAHRLLAEQAQRRPESREDDDTASGFRWTQQQRGMGLLRDGTGVKGNPEGR